MEHKHSLHKEFFCRSRPVCYKESPLEGAEQFPCILTSDQTRGLKRLGRAELTVCFLDFCNWKEISVAEN